MTNDAISEAAKNPIMNLGKRLHISIAPTFSMPPSSPPSTLVAKKIETKNATKPIRMFCIDLTSTAAVWASSPRAVPATTTAPVLSTVPPMSAPPIIGDMPTALIMGGMPTIIITVKIIEIDTATVRSVFLHFAAAPVAMAAEVPHTLVADARVITRGLFLILSTLVPNHHMKIMHSGHTIHEMPRP